MGLKDRDEVRGARMLGWAAAPGRPQKLGICKILAKADSLETSCHSVHCLEGEIIETNNS